MISFLAKLREFNPAIGTYVSYSMMQNFNYLIKLNNGEIIVSSTLIAIFIQKPTSISNTTYQNTALQFLVRVDDEASLNKKKNNSKVLLFVFVMLLLIIVISTYLPNHQ